MSKLMIALFVTAGLGYAGVNSAATYAPKTTVASTSASMSKEGYAQAKKDADAQYKIDKERCSSLSGNAKDICMAEAKGKDDVARAEAAAAYENTPKTRENARVAHAEAAYKVSIEKCDDLAGNQKDVCVKEAKAALVRGQGRRQGRPGRDGHAQGRGGEAGRRQQGSERGQARRRLQGRDREMRRARRTGQGRLHRQREGAIRQVLRSMQRSRALSASGRRKQASTTAGVAVPGRCLVRRRLIRHTRGSGRCKRS